MNVVYIKTFSNGKKYVGITNNFNRRMYQHQYDAYTKNSQLPVHCAMRKYDHETQIVFSSENYQDVIDNEILIIQSLKDTGYELYNMTDGGEGVIGFVLTKEHKEKISVAAKGRKHTKKTKEKMSKVRKGKKKTKETRERMKEAQKRRAKPQSYYEETPTLRDNFKKICKVRGWNFKDFEETFAEWYLKTNGERQRKFYYKLKDVV